jgi:hypothetical protein
MNTYRCLSLLCLLGLVACSDDDSTPLWDAGATDASVTSDGGGSTTTDTLSAVLVLGPETAAPNPPAATGLAVINSDYRSASLSLVDPVMRTVRKDGCISSGTATPRLSMALSGDVTLPSQPQPGNFVVLVDRGNATLTWVDPGSCNVVSQMSVSGGFKSNPHDVLVLTATKGYVTRYGTAMSGEGSDIAIINPTAGTITGRIDLKGQATMGPAGKTILPGPDRMVLVDGKVYVVLNNLTAAYDAAGAGRVVVIDPATDMVTGNIDLPTLKNCGAVTVAPGTKSLVVGCSGPYSDGAKQIDSSGVASIDLTTTPPMVKVLPGALFTKPVSSVAMVSGTRGYTVVQGHSMPAPAVPDALWTFDLAAGTAGSVFNGFEPFSLGGLSTGLVANRVYLSDGYKSGPRFRLFDVSNPMAANLIASIPSTTAGLPPRSAATH